LADQGDIDWSDHARGEDAEAERPPERAGMAGLVRSPRTSDRPPPGTLERRRRIAVFAAVALVVLIVIIVVVATSGGGGGSPSVTPPTTQPSTTPTTTATTPATPSTPSIHVTVPAGGNLSVGDNGSQVTELQKALTQLKYYNGKVDGDFGTGTEAAVVAFQNDHNLKPDGIVGSKTADAINQALASGGA
jgi:biopolymer transport protein ExbD